MKSIEKAAYGRGHVASGSAQGLFRKKPEQFQYIPPRVKRQRRKTRQKVRHRRDGQRKNGGKKG